MTTPKWKQISEESFKDIVANSNSYREIAVQVGYKVKNGTGSGSANKSIQKGIEFYKIDDSHLKGQGWNKDNFNYDWMVKGYSYHSRNGKALIALRGRKCERCGLTEWIGEPIPLETHHKDGDKTNNESNNLELLCPNCHSFTPFYRRRKE